MTGKLLATAACVAGLGVAQAQYPTQPGSPYGTGSPYGGYGLPSGGTTASPNVPYSNQGPYAPNVYNRATQPISPSLNLLRGTNPAVNYYYGVRPGTVGGAGGVSGFANVGQGGMRQPFFPQQYDQTDLLADPDQPTRVFPPAGHPVVYNNTLGYFPSAGGGGRGARPGVLGVGSGGGQSRPAAPRK